MDVRLSVDMRGGRVHAGAQRDRVRAPQEGPPQQVLSRSLRLLLLLHAHLHVLVPDSLRLVVQLVDELDLRGQALRVHRVQLRHVRFGHLQHHDRN